jgi:predicted nucleic acid-binding protein
LHAEALRLTFTGTIGILLRAKVEGRIARIEHVLEHLDLLGFRLSARTRAAVLKQAGE